MFRTYPATNCSQLDAAAASIVPFTSLHGLPVEDGRHRFAAIAVTTLAPMGGYAVHIGFSDGHARGIFPWVYLRVHGCRQVQELAYGETITEALPNHEFLGEAISGQLVYYPTVTREPFRNRGRITDLMVSGKLFADIGLPAMAIEADRFML